MEQEQDNRLKFTIHFQWGQCHRGIICSSLGCDSPPEIISLLYFFKLESIALLEPGTLFVMSPHCAFLHTSLLYTRLLLGFVQRKHSPAPSWIEMFTCLQKYITGCVHFIFALKSHLYANYFHLNIVIIYYFSFICITSYWPNGVSCICNCN